MNVRKYEKYYLLRNIYTTIAVYDLLIMISRAEDIPFRRKQLFLRNAFYRILYGSDINMPEL